MKHQDHDSGIQAARPTRALAVALILGLLAGALGGCGASNAGDGLAGDQPAELVSRFVDRFNDHDVSGMTSLAADEIAWFSIEGGTLTPNATGSDELASGLSGYFEAIPTVRTNLEHLHGAGSFAVARERVSWTTDTGEHRSQASWSVYEIREGKIANVWYYPAEQ